MLYPLSYGRLGFAFNVAEPIGLVIITLNRVAYPQPKASITKSSTKRIIQQKVPKIATPNPFISFYENYNP